MQNSKIQLGFAKPLPKQYRIWFVLLLIAVIIFNSYIFSFFLKDNIYGSIISILLLPSIFIVSLPSLFPEKEIFQLFVQFSDKQLLYRNNYLKPTLVIEYSEIKSITIQPTKIIIETKKETVEIPFNSMGFKTTKKIKANFEALKKELD